MKEHSSAGILYISYDGMTDQLGQSQVLPYLSGLSRRGYQIHLLSCEKPERFERFKAQIQALCDREGITWHPIPYTAKPPVLSTLRDIMAMRRSAFALHLKLNFQVVHCRSYIAGLVGLEMKRRFATKFLFDMRGFWADERVDGGLWKLKNPIYATIYNFFKGKEKQFLAEADQVISLTHAGRKEMERWDKRLPHPLPVTVIPCCVDSRLFDPSTVSEERKGELRTQLGIRPEQIVLGYVGSIGTWYLLEEMLQYFKELKHVVPDAVFLFLTNEPPSLILSSIVGYGLKPGDFRILAASRADVPAYISLMHHSVFFIKPSYSKKASSPTKQGELMSMGVPVVCNAGVGDTAHVVNTYHSGVVVEVFTTEALAEAAKTMMGSRFDADAIRKGAEEYYGLEHGVELYQTVYEKCLDGKT